MKKLATVIANIALIGKPALAADIAVKAPPPPPAPVYSWTGWYVGLNAGWVDANGDVNTNAAILASPSPPDNATAVASAATNQLNNRSSGFLGGGQFGYNYQFTSVLVAGFEADIQGSSLRGSASTSKSVPAALVIPVPGTWNTNTTVSHRLDYLGTVRARIGLAAAPTLLLYGTGGLAYGKVDLNTSMVINPVGAVLHEDAPPGFASGSFSGIRAGWTAGGGLEWMFLPNWSAKLEYLHYDLGSATYATGGYSFDTTPTRLVGTGFLTIATSATEHFSGDIVRVGLNYQFH
jgi:outer membrane immunogenic protein